MFFGAVPKQAIEQVTRTVPFTEWRDVFVGCSGSFRFDRAVHDVHPTVRVHANDVSLISCSLGALVTGAPFPMTFKGRFAFVEEHLAGKPLLFRCGAIQIAQEMAKYRGKNAFAVSHFAHYQERFAEFLTIAALRLERYIEPLKVASFHGGDFRDQAGRAFAAGGGVAAFPPTYKNDYERLYRFVDENADWQRPAYRLWNPAELESWIDELKEMGVRYCVLVERKLTRHDPATVFYGQLKPVYTYADRALSSVKRLPRAAQAFAYTPCDVDALTPSSKVEIINATSAQMNFLKDSHLAKEIQHTNGIANFLVMLDGRLAGGFIFIRAKYGENGIYMLCDFSMGAKTRLSKLIIMLATSETILSRMEIKLMQRIENVYTTAYTTRPVSMKYRGVFELMKRFPERLYYASKVRRQTPAEIYADWFQRFLANARHPGGAVQPQAARKERPVHEGAAV
jgi:hypothetical protein